MLQTMPQTATPSLPDQSFARLLADLATPAPNPAERPLVWNDDDLEDDVATLSYERALRARGRYLEGQAAIPTDRSLLQPAEPDPIHSGEDRAGQLRSSQDFVGHDSLSGMPSASSGHTSKNTQESSAGFQTKGNVHSPTALENNLKSASVTIRLSEVESAQLRQRAAEAGLTVSAYLRSCTFEAESLRAQVKEALAQLRPAPSSPDGASHDGANPEGSSARKTVPARFFGAADPRRPRFEWLWAILTPWRFRHRVVRA